MNEEAHNIVVAIVIVIARVGVRCMIGMDVTIHNCASTFLCMVCTYCHPLPRGSYLVEIEVKLEIKQ